MRDSSPTAPGPPPRAHVALQDLSPHRSGIEIQTQTQGAGWGAKCRSMEGNGPACRGVERPPEGGCGDDSSKDLSPRRGEQQRRLTSTLSYPGSSATQTARYGRQSATQQRPIQGSKPTASNKVHWINDEPHNNQNNSQRRQEATGAPRRARGRSPSPAKRMRGEAEPSSWLARLRIRTWRHGGEKGLIWAEAHRSRPFDLKEDVRWE